MNDSFAIPDYSHCPTCGRQMTCLVTFFDIDEKPTQVVRSCDACGPFSVPSIDPSPINSELAA